MAIGASGPILVDEFRFRRSRRELRGDFCEVFEPKIMKLRRKIKIIPEKEGFGLMAGFGPRILTSTVGDRSDVLISKAVIILTLNQHSPLV